MGEATWSAVCGAGLLAAAAAGGAAFLPFLLAATSLPNPFAGIPSTALVFVMPLWVGGAVALCLVAGRRWLGDHAHPVPAAVAAAIGAAAAVAPATPLDFFAGVTVLPPMFAYAASLLRSSMSPSLRLAPRHLYLAAIVTYAVYGLFVVRGVTMLLPTPPGEGTGTSEGGIFLIGLAVFLGFLITAMLARVRSIGAGAARA